MVVKAIIGRKRYIVFKIDSESDISKRDLIYALNKLLHYNLNNKAQGDNSMVNTPKESKDAHINIASEQNTNAFVVMPWVIKVTNNYGLIRCHHLDKNKTINLLQSIEWTGKKKFPVNIRTLGTTGTIKKARKKYLDKLILYPLKSSKKK